MDERFSIHAQVGRLASVIRWALGERALVPDAVPVAPPRPARRAARLVAALGGRRADLEVRA